MQSSHNGVPGHPSLQEAFGPIRDAKEPTRGGGEGRQKFLSGVWLYTNSCVIIFKLILIKRTLLATYFAGTGGGDDLKFWWTLSF